VVYAVFASLGFAAIENVLYVFDYGIGTAAGARRHGHPRPRHLRRHHGRGLRPGQSALPPATSRREGLPGTKAWLLPPWPTALTTSLWVWAERIFYVYFVALIVLGVTLRQRLRKARRPGESLCDRRREPTRSK
jgi:hypothetical protein